MFVYSQWDLYCSEMSKNFNCIRADEIPLQLPDTRWVSIKHDVETNVPKAVKIAQIEAKYGIKSTYFVQSYLLKDNLSLLSKIASLGHEVTYHYDVLDSNRGNFDKAEAEFLSCIEQFRNSGFEVRTVCPHGNPVMNRDGWSSNKDFFRNSVVANRFSNIFDIVVQAKEVIKGEYSYISDAGYGWKLIGNVDNNDIQDSADVKVKNLTDVTNMLKETRRAIISSHPHRWSGNYFFAYFNMIVFKVIRCFVRLISKVDFVKGVLSKYYYLAKKI